MHERTHLCRNISQRPPSNAIIDITYPEPELAGRKTVGNLRDLSKKNSLAHPGSPTTRLARLTTTATKVTATIGTGGKAATASSSERHSGWLMRLSCLDVRRSFRRWEAGTGKVSGRAVRCHVTHRLLSLSQCCCCAPPRFSILRTISPCIPPLWLPKRPRICRSGPLLRPASSPVVTPSPISSLSGTTSLRVYGSSISRRSKTSLIPKST